MIYNVYDKHGNKKKIHFRTHYCRAVTRVGEIREETSVVNEVTCKHCINYLVRRLGADFREPKDA